jgi:hypothetical protein
MDEAELRALADRLRKGRLIAPATTILIEGLGEVSTGETREVSHPDAIAAANAIEWLLNHRRQAEEAMRERAAKLCDKHAVDDPRDLKLPDGEISPQWADGWMQGAEYIAAAIRSMEVE